MRRISAYLIVWLLILLFSSPSWAQKESKPQNLASNQEDAIKVETTLINVPIVATDKAGHYIADLTQEDFLVYENGAQQQIELFAAETLPINVVLLIDMSSSTRRSSQALKKAAQAFVDNVRPNDKVKVISFTYNINELNSFTDNKQTLTHAIENLTPGGSTRLYDAVEYCARVIFNKIEGRKALIVLTDGVDSSSYLSPLLAIRETVENNTLVYVVKYPIDSHPSYPGRLSPPASSSALVTPKGNYQAGSFDFLKELVDQTGGAIIPSPSFDSLVEKMKNVAEQLRHVYAIGYYPTNAIQNGGYRKIEIKLSNHKASLRYKKGYDAHTIEAQSLKPANAAQEH